MILNLVRCPNHKLALIECNRGNGVCPISYNRLSFIGKGEKTLGGRMYASKYKVLDKKESI